MPEIGEMGEMSEEETIAEKEKYFERLREWLRRAQTAQANACMPYYFMAYQMLFHLQASGSGPFLNNNYQQRGQRSPFPYTRPDDRNANDVGNGRQPAQNRPPGIEYAIPPIWKRVVAEIFDFFFFLLSKFFMYYLTENYLGILEAKSISGVRTLNLLHRMSEDYNLDLELTSEIFILEMWNRVAACIFETLFISENAFFGSPWGGTPGKFIMGLKVVSATSVVQSDNRQRETVFVYPGTFVSFKTALMRSAIKNALISLIFPICMFTFFFQHNRTTYDVMTNVIVVESNTEENNRRND